VLPRRDTERLHQLPGREIRTADVTHLALTYGVVERAEGLFRWRERIKIVNLVEVDVVGLKTPKAGFERLHDMKAD